MEAKPQNKPEPLLLTPAEAAEVVRLCSKSLYLAVRKGELRCVKLGRSVRYRREDLQRWLETKLTSEGA